MDYIEWTHKLADCNKVIYNIKRRLERVKNELSTSKAKLANVGKFPQYPELYNAVELKEKINNYEKEIRTLEEKLEKQEKECDALYDQEPPK